MELGELKAFVTVAAEHSFSPAEIKLCRSQPAVSQAIRRLDDDLGERLFDRSTKYVTLTQAGDALLPEAIGLLRMAAEAAATIRQLSQRHRIVPGVDSLQQAVANGLGIGIVPCAVISSLTALVGLVVIPLAAARGASAC
jgi:DNA-binding transcriptional LysR family regulator